MDVTNIVYATETYVSFLKFFHVLRGMISDVRARTKYKYMEYAFMKICYFRVRHERTYTICQALRFHVSLRLELTLFRMGGGGFRPPKKCFLNNFFYTKDEGL